MSSSVLVNNPSVHVRRGDVVEVLSGEDKGKSGKILTVNRVKGTAIVEGIRFIKKHMRKTQENPEGGIIEKEGPIPVSKLKVIERSKKAE